jgi:hypothetical protein
LGKWINQFTQSRNLNWNSSKLLHEDRVTSNLVSELFKPFELFENNRELLDNLAYFILCQKTFMILRLKIIIQVIFINMREKYQSINYGSNIHLHFVTSLKFKN